MTTIELLDARINREAVQAQAEHDAQRTPRSMLPRNQRGCSEERVLVTCHDGARRWARKDADIITLRKIIFGKVDIGDLRTDMRSALETARASLGFV